MTVVSLITLLSGRPNTSAKVFELLDLAKRKVAEGKVIEVSELVTFVFTEMCTSTSPLYCQLMQLLGKLLCEELKAAPLPPELPAEVRGTHPMIPAVLTGVTGPKPVHVNVGYLQ